MYGHWQYIDGGCCLQNKRCVVEITKNAEKQMAKLPRRIVEAVYIWAESVELMGIAKVRQLTGYSDKPLLGFWRGCRSIRLNRAYRLFYFEADQSSKIIITVIEVNKHEY
jgi:proteic killer suppression protein